MDLKLKGKRVIVLGGTRGIGRAIADTFADEGANVAICARNKDQIDTAVTELAKRGIRVTGASVDMAKSAELKAWVSDVAAQFGGIDILVSNASAIAMGTSPEAWQQLLSIDILGASAAFEAARPHLEKAAAEKSNAKSCKGFFIIFWFGLIDLNLINSCL